MRILITDQRYDDYTIEKRITDRAGYVLDIFSPPMDWPDSLSKADALLVDQAVITESDLDFFKGKVICRYGTGCDNVPVSESEKRGIKVITVPDYCTEEVADHALAMILSCARRLNWSDKAVRAGQWNVHPHWPIKRLSASVLGIVGFGRIGQELARRGGGLFREVLVYPGESFPVKNQNNVRFVDLDEVVSLSDYVSLHIPAKKKNIGLINERILSLMKRTAFLINTARGALIDDQALLKILLENRIAGAALDVFIQEPPAVDNPYFRLDNVLLSDHSAYYSAESFEELRRRTAENAVRFLEGIL